MTGPSTFPAACPAIALERRRWRRLPGTLVFPTAVYPTQMQCIRSSSPVFPIGESEVRQHETHSNEPRPHSTRSAFRCRLGKEITMSARPSAFTQTRRGFVGSAALTVLATQFGVPDSARAESFSVHPKELTMATIQLDSTPAATAAIRPFHVEVPQADLDDLTRRIAATRWPTEELVEDRSQGVQVATLRALADYWATEYDWRACEARLNALPQFTTEIDGVDIHFIHVTSRHENALPLIMTHGWPGSVIELLESDRSADRSDRVRWNGRRRIPPGAAVLAWLRLLGRAGRSRLGFRTHRARLGGAHGPARLHPLRRAGW